MLLVGVVNLANLVLARDFGRLRELATRTALGASLPRIAGQLVTETVLVAVLGGVAGLIAGWWALRSLALLRLDWLPRRHEIGLDGPAALLTVALSVCVGVLMAVVPVARLSRLQVSDALRDADRSTTGGIKARRVGGALATSQIALAFMLLFSAGALLASFRAILRIDPGFEAAGVVSASTNLPALRYRDAPR